MDLHTALYDAFFQITYEIALCHDEAETHLLLHYPNVPQHLLSRSAS